MKYVLLLCALLFVSGCTDEQIARLDAIALTAEEKVKVGEDAVAAATIAVEQARKLAEELGIEKAKPVMDKAEQALVLATDAVATAKATAAAARKTADAAKAAQASGSGTFQVIMAGLGGGIAGLLAALPKIISLARAFRQTVKGIGDARDAMEEAEFQAKVGVHLAAAQDEKVKRQVDKLPGGQTSA